jgi:hypothetical protein
MKKAGIAKKIIGYSLVALLIFAAIPAYLYHLETKKIQEDLQKIHMAYADYQNEYSGFVGDPFFSLAEMASKRHNGIYLNYFNQIPEPLFAGKYVPPKLWINSSNHGEIDAYPRYIGIDFFGNRQCPAYLKALKEKKAKTPDILLWEKRWGVPWRAKDAQR